MAEVHHFQYGWITPLMAYCLSVLGSLLGLVCTARARRIPTNRKRISWLVLAAVAIGGTGIWVMHFMAMIGFGVVGSEIRYDIPTTALSALVSVTVVGIGLFIAGLGKKSLLKIGIGGVLAGLGVNAMHYMGMAAMRLDGEVDYDPTRVGLSIVIAVVAATVALWLSVTVRGGAAIFASAMVMGVAVCGMHYTGMSAMSVRLDDRGEVAGASAMTLIAPIALAVIFVVMGLIYSVLAAQTEEDRAGTAYISSRLSGAPAPTNPAFAGVPSGQPAQSGAQQPSGRERAAGLWAATRQAATRSTGRGADAPVPDSRASGVPQGGFAGASQNGYGGAPQNGYGGAPAYGARGPQGGDVSPGLGASLMATEPVAGPSRWEGLTDPAPAAAPGQPEQNGAESLPQRQPSAPPAPWPPSANGTTLAQQFQARPRTPQDQ